MRQRETKTEREGEGENEGGKKAMKDRGKDRGDKEQNLSFSSGYLRVMRSLSVSWLKHARVSQGRICTDNFTCCHTEIELAYQTPPNHSILTPGQLVPALTL